LGKVSSADLFPNGNPSRHLFSEEIFSVSRASYLFTTDVGNGLLGSVEVVSKKEYAVKVGDFQWVRNPPGQSVARPEAIRAAQEVTKCVEVLWCNGAL